MLRSTEHGKGGPSDPFHVVLVEPEIPANTGNIARLCAATKSVLHLVEPLGFRLDDTAMKRAGMDYLDIAVIHRHASLKECLTSIFGRSFGEGSHASLRSSIYYLTTKLGAPYWQKQFRPGDVFVFGRETKGLPEELLIRNQGQCLTIPMPESGVRSLNLATSVGIVLYEALRQINSNGDCLGR